MDTEITIVYIRHAPKLYKNDKHFNKSHHPHDSPIKFEHIIDITNKSNKLIENFGNPTVCLCSPYKRTRQTLDYLISEINENIPKIVDPTICEYLGNVKQQYLDLTPKVDEETLKYDISPIGETKQNFIKRLNNHIRILGLKNLNINKNILNYSKDNKLTIWVITHGYVISNIYEILTNIKIDRPKELTGFYVKGKIGKIEDINFI